MFMIEMIPEFGLVKEGFGNQINLCWDQGLNPGPSARKSDTLPPGHQVTKKSIYLYGLADHVSNMTQSQESRVSSTQDSLSLRPTEDSISRETQEQGVSALVNKLSSCSGAYENEKSSYSSSGDEKKMQALLPWIKSFNSLCQSVVGCRSLKRLEKLLQIFWKNMSDPVKKSLKMTNRTAKLKKYMSEVLLFFHMSYLDLQEVLDNNTYLERMSDLVSMYIDMEIRASKEETCPLYGNGDQEIVVGRNRKVLNLVRPSTAPMYTMLYVRYLLAYKLWKKVVGNAEEKKRINKLAALKLSAPTELTEKVVLWPSVLPKVPKSKKNIGIDSSGNLFDGIWSLLCNADSNTSDGTKTISPLGVKSERHISSTQKYKPKEKAPKKLKMKLINENKKPSSSNKVKKKTKCKKKNAIKPSDTMSVLSVKKGIKLPNNTIRKKKKNKFVKERLSVNFLTTALGTLSSSLSKPSMRDFISTSTSHSFSSSEEQSSSFGSISASLGSLPSPMERFTSAPLENLSAPVPIHSSPSSSDSLSSLPPPLEDLQIMSHSGISPLPPLDSELQRPARLENNQLRKSSDSPSPSVPCPDTVAPSVASLTPPHPSAPLSPPTEDPQNKLELMDTEEGVQRTQEQETSKAAESNIPDVPAQSVVSKDIQNISELPSPNVIGVQLNCVSENVIHTTEALLAPGVSEEMTLCVPELPQVEIKAEPEVENINQVTQAKPQALCVQKQNDLQQDSKIDLHNEISNLNITHSNDETTHDADQGFVPMQDGRLNIKVDVDSMENGDLNHETEISIANVKSSDTQYFDAPSNEVISEQTEICLQEVVVSQVEEEINFISANSKDVPIEISVANKTVTNLSNSIQMTNSITANSIKEIPLIDVSSNEDSAGTLDSSDSYDSDVEILEDIINNGINNNSGTSEGEEVISNVSNQTPREDHGVFGLGPGELVMEVIGMSGPVSVIYSGSYAPREDLGQSSVDSESQPVHFDETEHFVDTTNLLDDTLRDRERDDYTYGRNSQDCLYRDVMLTGNRLNESGDTNYESFDLESYPLFQEDFMEGDEDDDLENTLVEDDLDSPIREGGRKYKSKNFALDSEKENSDGSPTSQVDVDNRTVAENEALKSQDEELLKKIEESLSESARTKQEGLKDNFDEAFHNATKEPGYKSMSLNTIQSKDANMNCVDTKQFSGKTETSKRMFKTPAELKQISMPEDFVSSTVNLKSEPVLIPLDSKIDRTFNLGKRDCSGNPVNPPCEKLETKQGLDLTINKEIKSKKRSRRRKSDGETGHVKSSKRHLKRESVIQTSETVDEFIRGRPRGFRGVGSNRYRGGRRKSPSLDEYQERVEKSPTQTFEKSYDRFEERVEKSLINCVNKSHTKCKERVDKLSTECIDRNEAECKERVGTSTSPLLNFSPNLNSVGRSRGFRGSGRKPSSAGHDSFNNSRGRGKIRGPRSRSPSDAPSLPNRSLIRGHGGGRGPRRRRSSSSSPSPPTLTRIHGSGKRPKKKINRSSVDLGGSNRNTRLRSSSVSPSPPPILSRGHSVNMGKNKLSPSPTSSRCDSPMPNLHMEFCPHRITRQMTANLSSSPCRPVKEDSSDEDFNPRKVSRNKKFSDKPRKKINSEHEDKRKSSSHKREGSESARIAVRAPGYIFKRPGFNSQCFWNFSVKQWVTLSLMRTTGYVQDIARHDTIIPQGSGTLVRDTWQRRVKAATTIPTQPSAPQTAKHDHYESATTLDETATTPSSLEQNSQYSVELLSLVGTELLVKREEWLEGLGAVLLGVLAVLEGAAQGAALFCFFATSRVSRIPSSSSMMSDDDSDRELFFMGQELDHWFLDLPVVIELARPVVPRLTRGQELDHWFLDLPVVMI
uniref:Uncharacterized protein n=1 Tax=Timema tahoe TaxID=61484 RepID=A0A7R9FNG9_9NEOP|nr:unnamed protein product [Timema tahoe]